MAKQRMAKQGQGKARKRVAPRREGIAKHGKAKAEHSAVVQSNGKAIRMGMGAKAPPALFLKSGGIRRIKIFNFFQIPYCIVS